MTTIQQFLPNDLVEEILCRVPATSLKRLRFTCKQWNRLFKNPRFVSKHSDKAAKQFLALMLTKRYVICPMSINLLGVVPSLKLKNFLKLLHPCNNLYQFVIAEVFHCDGLLLGIGRYGSTMVAWNPCTGQTRWIEPRNVCKKKSRRFVLGYSQDKKSCSKSYKILSFKNDGEDSEIYDFNSHSWRSIILDDGISIFPGWSVFACSDHNVSLKGNTYWFADEKENYGTGTYLLRFDFSTEKTSVCGPLPYPGEKVVTTSLSVVREEKLSVLFRRDYYTPEAEIWVTNKIDETKSVSWSKFLTLDLSHDLQISCCVSFLLEEEKKVVVMCCENCEDEDKWRAKIYIVGEDNKVTTVDFGVATSLGCWPVILNYVPSLVRI